MGATTGCAQCHDHKYDPFTIKDFYSLAAFFADIQEKPVGRRNPNLLLPTAEQEKKLEELESAKKETEKIRDEKKSGLEKERNKLRTQLTQKSSVLITMNLQIVRLKRRKEFLSKMPLPKMPYFTANGNLQKIRSFQVQNHLFEPVWGIISIFSIIQKILTKLKMIRMNFLHTLFLTPKIHPSR